jgi:L-aspartate oxidase
VDLRSSGGRVTGVALMDRNGEVHEVRAQAVLLATGGLGQVYRETTNPSVATGDGVAMAFRAGAEVSDMEFVQFHPTALYVPGAPRFLLSEALRGEGAYLRNAELARFMPRYHDMAELAPRDVVARAIAHELEVEHVDAPVVYLDMTHLDARALRARFPRIHSTCLKHNIDIATDLVPVRPAAHYAMGGVRTDLDGRSGLKGLYAAGEAAATGVHGANRLASNSLLEGLVYGARAGDAMRQELGARRAPAAGKPNKSSAKKAAFEDVQQVEDAARCLTHGIQDLMWKNVGIVREGKTLRRALTQLDEWSEKLPAPKSRAACEARNLYTVARLITRSALAREESRGAHYRLDFPEHNDAKFLKHSILKGNSIRFE